MASKTVSVRFPEAEAEEIIKQAEREGLTPSDIVRNGYRTSQDNEHMLRLLFQRLSMMETSVLKGIKRELKNLRVEIEE